MNIHTNTNDTKTTKRTRVTRGFAVAAALAAAVSISACGAEPDHTSTVDAIPAAQGLPSIGVHGTGGNSMAHAVAIVVEPIGPFEGQDAPGGHGLSIPVPDTDTFDPEQGPGSNSL